MQEWLMTTSLNPITNSGVVRPRASSILTISRCNLKIVKTMWINREISAELRAVSRTFPALVLIGPRQVGKTAVIERTFPDYGYVSLDVASNAEMAETRPQEFLRRYPPPVILDEIQYAPSVFRHLKTTIDQKKENGLFLLCGSQNFMLMEAVSDSLAGRAAVIPFLGLSATEWLLTQESKSLEHCIDFLWKGSFPALWADPDNAPARDRWYQGYVSTYLERDVRNLLNVGSLRDFQRFLRACAARCARTLNMSELGRDVGVSATTARQWISVLSSSNLILLLEPYYRSLGKRLAKSPKLYFTDTGLAAFLMGFQSPEAMWSSREAGPLWENHVVTQWLRWRDWHQPSTTLWYWRDQAGNEVDLLLEMGDRLLAVECKLSEQPSSRDLRGIRRLRDFYGAERVQHAYIACTTQAPFAIDEGASAVSGWTVWDLSPPA